MCSPGAGSGSSARGRGESLFAAEKDSGRRATSTRELSTSRSLLGNIAHMPAAAPLGVQPINAGRTIDSMLHSLAPAVSRTARNRGLNPGPRSLLGDQGYSRRFM